MPKKQQSFRAKQTSQKDYKRRKRGADQSDSDFEDDLPLSVLRQDLLASRSTVLALPPPPPQMTTLLVPDGHVTHLIAADVAGPSTAKVCTTAPELHRTTDCTVSLERLPIANLPPTLRMQLQSADTILDPVLVRNPPRTYHSRQYNTFRFSPTFAFTDHFPEHFLGEMSHLCSFCLAKHFNQEAVKGQYSSCCQRGKVSLLSLSETPQILQNLLTGNTPQCTNFKDHIREYNSALAFASFGAKTVDFPGRGPYCFAVHGQIYHKTGPSHPDHESERNYAQLYFLDTEEAAQVRFNRNNACLKETFQILDEIIRLNNPYYASYRMLKEVQEEQIRQAAISGLPIPEIYLAIERDINKDLNRYNRPTVSSEIACVFVGEEPPQLVDITVHPRGGHLRNISKLSPNLDPMVYPLLFPSGELGWKQNIPHVGPNRTSLRNKVTHIQYYAFRIAIRQGFSLIHISGKLFQQYIVDAYMKAESSRLWFIRQNQKALRAELYLGLRDYVQNRAQDENLRLGKLIVLPSTFVGSKRSMVELYLDAMAVVQKYGKPDFFITFTCNTTWKEITDALEPHEKVANRPDLVARIFHLKLMSLLNDLNHNHVLGVPAAYTYVVEFQKRGLPHAHILVILENSDRIHDSDDIDSIVRAEIPDPNLEKRLYDIVSRNMLHGPCGDAFPNSSCMLDGVCTKGFPKQFAENTVMNPDGYPEYRRRDNARVINVKGLPLDNRHVVPYNPPLLLKYNAHINVEICSSIRAVKYLYKYIYKGYDCATISVTSRVLQPQLNPHSEENVLQWDEVKTFLDCRYIGSPEAVWRILALELHGKNVVVFRLSLHLPNLQQVYFLEGEEEQAVQAAQNKDTHLLAWFKVNRNDPQARNYLYSEIVQHYTWQAKAHKWQKRKKGGFRTLGRIPQVNPKDQEKYFLRMLLTHVPGAQTFEDLRTVDGVTCSTFKEAARRLHLYEDEGELQLCLRQAAGYMMPRAMRQLFVVICVFCHPSDANLLWEQFLDVLCEDYTIKYSKDVAVNMALLDMERLFQDHNTSCKNFLLPEPLLTLPHEQEHVPLHAHEHAQIGNDMFGTANESQRTFITVILAAVTENVSGPRFFFLDGCAGSGKTFTYNTLIHLLRAREETVLAVAWTGIASTLLVEGRTCHSAFKFPIPITEKTVCNISPTSKEGDFLKTVKVIIWDEAPMASKHALHALDACLQDIMKNNLLFGGKVLILGGDFRQVLPIVPHAKTEHIISTSIRYSRMWKDVQLFKLTKNMRADEESSSFSEWILKLGNGTLDIEDRFATDAIQIPDVCISKGNLVEEVFGKHILQNASGRAILCTKNEHTFHINDQIVKDLPGEGVEYLSCDQAIAEPGDELQVPVEYLNSLTPSGLPPHRLLLKIGVTIVLLRNLHTASGLCNGTRLSVIAMQPHLLLCELISGSRAGQRVLIPRMSLTPSPTDVPFRFSRKQFPIRVAFSMTINKSQGQTFQKIGIYLPEPVFGHGQLYVAFSRVRNFDSVTVQIIAYKNLQGQKTGLPGTYTKNIVHKQIL